jgi:hypothetical protein
MCLLYANNLEDRRSRSDKLPSLEISDRVAGHGKTHRSTSPAKECNSYR